MPLLGQLLIPKVPGLEHNFGYLWFSYTFSLARVLYEGGCRDTSRSLPRGSGFQGARRRAMQRARCGDLPPAGLVGSLLGSCWAPPAEALFCQGTA